jgi:hypothetical protein
MMIERIEPKKIRVYAVVPFQQWEFVKNDEIENQYLNDYDYWQEYDYAVTAIMVEESLVFLDDNIHSHPDRVLEGVIAGLEYFFPLSLTKEILFLDEDINEYNKTKVQEAIYNKWKSEN